MFKVILLACVIVIVMGYNGDYMHEIIRTDDPKFACNETQICNETKSTCCFDNATHLGDCLLTDYQCCGLDTDQTNALVAWGCPRDIYTCGTSIVPSCYRAPSTGEPCRDTGKTLVCEPPEPEGFVVSWFQAQLLQFNITFCRCANELCETFPGIALDVIYATGTNPSKKLPMHQEVLFSNTASIIFKVVPYGEFPFYVDIVIDGLDTYETGFSGVLSARKCKSEESCMVSELVRLQTATLGVCEGEVEDVCDALVKDLHCPTDNCIEGSLVLFLAVFGGVGLCLVLFCVVKKQKAKMEAEKQRKEEADADRKIAEQLGITKKLDLSNKPGKLLEEEEAPKPKPEIVMPKPLESEPTAKIAEIEVRSSKSSRSYGSQQPGSYAAPMAHPAPAYVSSMPPNYSALPNNYSSMPQQQAFQQSMGMTGYDQMMMQNNMMMGQPMMGQPMMGQPMMGQPMMGQPMDPFGMQQGMMMQPGMGMDMGMQQGMMMQPMGYQDPMMMDPNMMMMNNNMMMGSQQPGMYQQNQF